MELLWTVSSLKRPRPSQYRSPSWTWTSVDDPIEYFNRTDVDDLEPLVTVIDADVITADGATTGKIESGITAEFTTNIRGVGKEHWYCKTAAINFYDSPIFLLKA
jgi:hypothetical protein